jgi:hypothetical protein
VLTDSATAGARRDVEARSRPHRLTVSTKVVRVDLQDGGILFAWRSRKVISHRQPAQARWRAAGVRRVQVWLGFLNMKPTGLGVGCKRAHFHSGRQERFIIRGNAERTSLRYALGGLS